MATYSYEREQSLQLIKEISNPETREAALKQLSKMREVPTDVFMCIAGMRSRSRSRRNRHILVGAGAGAGAAEKICSEPEPEPEP